MKTCADGTSILGESARGSEARFKMTSPEIDWLDWNMLQEPVDCFSMGDIQSVRLARMAVDITLDVNSSRGRYMIRLGNARRHSLATLEKAISFGALAQARSPGLVVTPVLSTAGTYIIPIRGFWPYMYLSVTNYIAGREMAMSADSVMRGRVIEFLKSFTCITSLTAGGSNESTGRWRRWTSDEFCRLYDVRNEIIPRVSPRAASLLASALSTLDDQLYENPRIVHGDLSPRNIIETKYSTFTLIDLGHVGIGCIDLEIGNWCGAVLAGCWDPDRDDACLASMTSFMSEAFDRPEKTVLGMCALRLARGMLMTNRLVADSKLRLRRVIQLRQMLERVSVAYVP